MGKLTLAPKKRIKITRVSSVSRKELARIGVKFQKLDLEVSRSNLLKQHYRIQIAPFWQRFLASFLGIFIIGFGLYHYDIICLLFFCLFAGGILLFAGIRGRRKELNEIIDFVADGIGEMIWRGIFDGIDF